MFNIRIKHFHSRVAKILGALKNKLLAIRKPSCLNQILDKNCGLSKKRPGTNKIDTHIKNHDSI